MKQYKILVFGAGVIGSIFAGKLSLSGNDVTILARNKRLQELENNNLLIKIGGQKEISKVKVKVCNELKKEDIYDYVFVVVRNEQIKDALPVLSKNQSKNFVFMVNTSEGYSDWIYALGKERVIPAFPGAGGKIENGVLFYSLTSKMVQPTTLGEIDGSHSLRIKELKSILNKAGFPVLISGNMDRWQKTHVAMVAPLAYGIYYDGGNNYSFSKNKEAVCLMNKTLKENFRFLVKSGIGIEPSKMKIYNYVPISLLNFLIPKIFNTKWAETVILNHALAARKEMEALAKGFVRLAESKGFRLYEFEKLMKIK